MSRPTTALVDIRSSSRVEEWAEVGRWRVRRWDNVLAPPSLETEKRGRR